MIADALKTAVQMEALTVVPWVWAAGFKISSVSSVRMLGINRAHVHSIDDLMETYLDARWPGC